jgi:hypothetical protein
LKRSRSDYQNGFIKYIRNSNKKQYKALENKLFEMMLNYHEVISDNGLREVDLN